MCETKIVWINNITWCRQPSPTKDPVHMRFTQNAHNVGPIFELQCIRILTVLPHLVHAVKFYLGLDRRMVIVIRLKRVKKGWITPVLEMHVNVRKSRRPKLAHNGKRYENFGRCSRSNFIEMYASLVDCRW